jgi:hypothetical protein
LRLPDFVIIGAMKAGTTTLFRWLQAHPGTSLPITKEPHFFSLDDRYRRGLRSYAEHFQDAVPELVTGESSVTYSDPDLPQAADRLLADLPDVRLVFLTRDPADRLKSHYLHEVRRSREKRSFREAITPDSTYVRRSSYYSCLRPYLDQASSRLLVVDMEALFGEDDTTWLRVQAHLGLSAVDRPPVHANETTAKRPYGGLALRMWHAGLLRHGKGFPAPVRALAGRALLGSREGWRRTVAEIRATPLAPDVLEILDRETRGLELALGRRLAWNELSPEAGP